MSPSCRHTALKIKMELTKIIASQREAQPRPEPPPLVTCVDERMPEEAPLPPPPNTPSSQYPQSLPKFGSQNAVSSDSGMKESSSQNERVVLVEGP